MTNSLALAARYGKDFLFDLVRVPIWWVTGGTLFLLRSAGRGIAHASDAAGVGVWAKNLFVPMYGQRDAWGRVISFMIRFANLVGRLLWVAVWTVVLCVVYIVWWALPLIALYVLVGSAARLATG